MSRCLSGGISPYLAEIGHSVSSLEVGFRLQTKSCSGAIMITIKPQKNVRAASVYFDGHLSKDDYYTKGGPDKGKWFGKLAEELGLRGPVKKETFDLLASGYNP